ncbi:4Fe-4S binding protein [candidate division KSB1 bacterium]|nr:4Fe-4S binding protein [candidate division KSB1 bacterium]
MNRDYNRRDFIGKGIRCVVGGIALSAIPGCHKNGISPYSIASICEHTCSGCGECLPSCDQNAIILPEPSRYWIEPESCSRCGLCLPTCHDDAIHIPLVYYDILSNACVGCGDCYSACQQEGKAISWERESYSVRGRCHPSRCGQPCLSVCSDQALKLVNGRMVVIDDRCTRCGKCVSVCPYGVIYPAKVVLNQELCLHCGSCYDVCAHGAILPTPAMDTSDPTIDASRCRKCGECLTHCPENAIKAVVHQAAIDPELCNGCGSCVEACTFDAIRF